MNKIKYLGFIIMIFSPVAISAQVSPIPVVEQEIREGTSIRMRSGDLERLKENAGKRGVDESDAERKIRFAAIKEDFEDIQKLQDTIIKAYTKSKKINYEKIAEAAGSMTIKARRLSGSLFGEKSADLSETKDSENSERFKQKSVRDLIIELDNTLGKFVVSPVFKDLKTVDLKNSKDAQTELQKIIDLSQNLFRTAENK